MYVNTTATNRQDSNSNSNSNSRANDLINQVAGMIAARLQSNDPQTISEGKKMLAACPLASEEVRRLMGLVNQV